MTEPGLALDWPQEGPKLLWSKKISEGGGNVSHGGPIVVGGKLFIPSRFAGKDQLLCLDALTGSDVWKQEYDAPGKLGFGGGARATPRFAAGRVHMLSAFGQLACFDAKEGKKLWERNLVAEFKGKQPNFGVASMPLVEGELVICMPGALDCLVLALKADSGQEAWRAGAGNPAYAPIQVAMLHGARVLLCYPASGLLALNPADGKELFNIKYSCAKNIASPVLQGDTLFLSNNDWGFSSWKIKNDNGKWSTSRQWITTADKDHTSSFILKDKALYFFEWVAAGGKLKAIDPADGHKLWETATETKGDNNCSLLLLDERHLLATQSDGFVSLYQASPKECVLKCRFKAVEPGCFAPAAVADGKLYVRGGQTLACFDLKGK